LGISSNIIFTGVLPDIRPALSAANVFVLASRNEGMGRVFIEAMTAKLPVIGTSVGGIPSLIRDGKTGMLVPSNDPSALANAMEKVLFTPEQIKVFVQNAFTSVFPEYSEDTMVHRLADLYTEVLNRSE
jgi:glycosyltransferase involved in cell wall biosynthesis